MMGGGVTFEAFSFSYILFVLVQVSLTFIYSYFLEWAFHILLHDRKKFFSGFKHHFGVHHKNSRKNTMYDESYKNPLSGSSIFEPISLTLLLAAHIPILFFFPVVYAALILCMCLYYYKHRKSHLDIEWGAKNMPWHYEHHMGKDQHKNWGVRTNLIDIIFKTNTEYITVKNRESKFKNE